MVEQDATDFSEQYVGGYASKVRDIEEKQRIIKDRLLLFGKNLVELKERIGDEMLEMKKDLEILKFDMERMKSFLETFSGEASKFARKEDLDILAKQAKMFQPIDFVRKKELKDMLRKRE